MKQKLLFLLTALCFGVISGVKAGVTVPTPVYFQDFESASTEVGSAGSNFGITGATLTGTTGAIITGDATFGKYYQNMSTAEAITTRANYLTLVNETAWNNLRTAVASSHAFAVSFWANAKVQRAKNFDSYWGAMFVGYTSAEGTTTPGEWDAATMKAHPFGPAVCSRGQFRYYNSADGTNYGDITDNNDTGRDAVGAWLNDDNWHHFAYVFAKLDQKTFTISCYVDGVKKYDLNETSYDTGMEMLNDIDRFVIGGSTPHWNDPDNAYAYDDIAIYDQALTVDQVNQIIFTKVPTLLEYGTNDVPWTTSRIAEWSGKALTLDGSVVKYAGTDNSDFSTYKTITPAANAIINVSAVWRARSNTGRYWSQNCGIYFRFGDIVVAQNDQDKTHGYTFAGLSDMHSVTKFTAGSYRVDIASCTWLKIDAEINTATNTLTSFTIKSEDGATTYVNVSDIALSNPDYKTVAIGFQRGGSHNAEKQEQLKSIKITQTAPAATYADYTVHFKDNNGATVKDDDVRNGEVGSTVNANSVDKETFYSGGYKYVYDNDGDGVEVTSDGTAELTVTYTKKGQFTYNVYAVNSSSEKLQNDPIATATTYEGESVKLAWSKYINVSGTWYVSSESTFTATVTEAGTKNVTYTPADGIGYFFEFENLDKSGTFAATQSGDNLSNNNSARFGKNSRTWTTAIAAGTYTLNIYCSGTNGKTPTLPMYYCDTDGSNFVYIGEATAASSGSWVLKQKTGVVIPDGKALCLYNTDGSNNSNYLVDYFTLTRTGDAAVSASLGTNGYATFASPYALDLANLPSGLTAYKAAVDGNTVRFTQVTEAVQANTGLLLKGSTSETYSIPVAANGSDISATNAFLVNTNGIDVESGYTYYGLLKNTLTFATFDPASVTIPSDKAYLKVSDGEGARLAIAFEDDATGINAIKAAEAEAQKDGKYLEGGKIVIVKNGVKYSTNGQILK